MAIALRGDFRFRRWSIKAGEMKAQQSQMKDPAAVSIKKATRDIEIKTAQQALD